MITLITGTTHGIGRATAMKFLIEGHEVIGIDCLPSSIEHARYTHCQVDVRGELPTVDGVQVLINNAGTLNEDDAISTNLLGYMKVAEKYAFQDAIRAVVNVGSISGRTGIETPYYVASQGGRIAYTKWLAMQLGNKYKAVVNSVDFGTVITDIEPWLTNDPVLVQAVANENILKKWSDADEAAEWIYFVAVTNKSMTGQDILIDNGEEANYNYISGKKDE